MLLPLLDSSVEHSSVSEVNLCLRPTADLWAVCRTATLGSKAGGCAPLPLLNSRGLKPYLTLTFGIC